MEDNYMKKATFIAVAMTAVVILTGCGAKTPGQVQQDAEEYNSDVIIEQHDTIVQQEKDIQARDDDISDLKNENEDLKNRIKELEETDQEKTAESEMAAEAETSVTVENAEAAKVPLIAKDQEHIQVSAFYHGKDIPLYVATEENRATAIENAKAIYTGVKDRNLSLIISGVSVTNVYILDDGFKKVEELSYDSVDNTYCAQYYMPGDGQYTFLIQTTNATHYYVTVVY